MEETTGRKWLWRVLDFINPLRDPSLTVAAVLTFIEEAGQHDPWYSILLVALVNWLAVRGILWLVVNFTFAATFLSRRFWWAIKHPRLAWRLLDAIGHEEIVIGGMPTLSEGILLQDGSTAISPMLDASGIHIVGELPAGTELPMLSIPGPTGQQGGDIQLPFGNNGFFPGSGAFTANAYTGNPAMNFQQFGSNDYVSAQSTDGLPQNMNQRASQEVENLRQQVEAYAGLLEDWIQFTEEKWRAVSDSQLGWKPLRGRWGSWDDIFSDAYAAKTSDPLAKAAQQAGEATARRFDTSKEKGSAASAVACFMRDMMTLRRSMDLIQASNEQLSQTSNSQPVVKSPPLSPLPRQFGNGGTGSLLGSSMSGGMSRSSLIRRPTQIFVDADTQK